MPQAKSNRSFARAAMMVACGVFLILATGIGASYAADDDDALPDEKFMRDFLRKLGLRNGQEAGIQYQERPPLVIPPSRDLPPPGVNSRCPRTRHGRTIRISRSRRRRRRPRPIAGRSIGKETSSKTA